MIYKKTHYVNSLNIPQDTDSDYSIKYYSHMKKE